MKNIKVQIEGGLGTITLNRPPVNVLNIEMMDEINDTLREWIEKRDLKVVLFNAEGKCFSAGVDLGGVTVSSVYGSCLGGGCELAIFCDLVIADETAKFGQPEIQVGVLPPIAAQVMPRIIGRKAAMDLILSGRIISTQEALDMGLINKVVQKDDLPQETETFIRPYLSLSAEVLRITKKTVKAGLMDDLEPSLKVIEDIYLNELMTTNDAQEGLKAFLEKRRPEWKNR